MSDAEVSPEGEGEGPGKLKRAKQVLDAAYEQARAGHYCDPPSMRVLRRAEQDYQEARQEGEPDESPAGAAETDLPASRPAPATLHGERDRTAERRDTAADGRADDPDRAAQADRAASDPER